MTSKKVSPQEIKSTMKATRIAVKAVENDRVMQIIQQLATSPMVQMVGTVAIAEVLESLGLLSSRWAGALEGGVITMVGLQALKDFGVVGAGAIAGTMGIGALSGGDLGQLSRIIPGTAGQVVKGLLEG